MGVLAIIRAILLSLLALALFNASSIAGDAGLAGIAGGATTWAIVMVVMVVLYIVGGIQVLRLREQGRIIMMVVAGLDIAIGLYFMTAVRGGANILGLALDAFIIYACVSQKDAFSKS